MIEQFVRRYRIYNLYRKGGGEGILGYVIGIGAGSTAPILRRIGGIVTIMTGPAAPMITDQKYAGLSRAAQRQYRRGLAQKCGARGPVADMFFLLCALASRDQAIRLTGEPRRRERHILN